VKLHVEGEVLHWRGPAPHHFVRMEPEACQDLLEIAARVSYGWGCIPVTVDGLDQTWTTSLFPKDGGFLVPLKAVVRRTAGVEVGDRVALTVTVTE
jgi:hypothetical protein